MKKYAIGFTFFCSLLSVKSNGQTFCPVKNGYAFYTLTIPGMQRVDENGNRINPKAVKQRFIYLESQSGVMFSIEDVYYNNIPVKKFTVVAAENVVNLGFADGTGNPLKIKAGKKFNLWKITIEPKENDKEKENTTISVKIKSAKKVSIFIIKKEIQISTPDSY